MTLNDLVSRIARAADSDQPLPAVASCLRALSAERDEVIDALGFLSGVGSDAEQAFYRSPRVSLLKVREASMMIPVPGNARMPFTPPFFTKSV